ncbi:UDP-2,3-diacylglucosamine diphosphatase [Aestuariibacter salexigens]|uniref:UDP-2,3-diacylglucosamine diphosphatase n=1 Tax=Aestuariibacter salexigens TaxID=226010 RepID=UPI00041B1FB0|nr:UDP-2,3-diacylglucosamine diphosphatase [Aestuariibacter salexigens]
MSFTYFISDLHLSEDRPDITDCLLTFLQSDVTEADALYILGDLFEYWIGDADINPFTTQVADALKAVSQHTPIYFIHGNRDFALGERYAKRCGMTLLPEQYVIDLYGTPTVILHGDEMCTRDIEYMKFRKKARGWWWPRLVMMIPLELRRKMVARARRNSDVRKKTMQMDIMDVTPQEVVNVMQRHGVTNMIHGHTHRPAIHDLNVGGQPAKRIVLGDWYDQGSMLKVTPQRTELINRPLPH